MYRQPRNVRDAATAYALKDHLTYWCCDMSIRSGMNRIPWVLMAVAFAAAFAYAKVEQAAAQRYAAGIFGASLGAALLLWGMEELKQGKIRGKRVYVSRTDAPVIFLLLLVGKRIAPATVMLGAAVWIVFFRVV